MGSAGSDTGDNTVNIYPNDLPTEAQWEELRKRLEGALLEMKHTALNCELDTKDWVPHYWCSTCLKVYFISKTGEIYHESMDCTDGTNAGILEFKERLRHWRHMRRFLTGTMQCNEVIIQGIIE